MAKTVTIGGRDTGRTGSGSGGGKSGGGIGLVGKSGTVDRNGNVSWHGGEERKDGGGYPSGSTGYGGDHGGGSGGHGSYSGKHFDNGRPITRYGDKLVASAAAFKKAQDEQAKAIAQSGLSAQNFYAAQAEANAKKAIAEKMAADKVAVEQAIWTKKMYDVEIARNRPPCEDIGEAIRRIRENNAKIEADAVISAQNIANAKVAAEKAANDAIIAQAAALQADAVAKAVAAAQVQAIAKTAAAAKELAMIKAIDDAEKIILQTMENERILTLDKISLKNVDMQHLADTLKPINYNLDAILLQNKNLNNLDFFHLMNGITLPNIGISHSVVYINLANNNLGDDAAQIISNALVGEQLTATRVIDVSGNKITEAGQDFFVRALNDPIVKRLAILIDDLSHNLRIQSGIKEDVVAELHSILKSAKNRGVDVDNLVVDTSFFTWAKNIKGSVKLATKGFIKCKWVDDPIGDHVKADLCDKLPDKIGKPLKKIIDVEGTVSCFISSYDQAKTSEFGAQMAITDLHVIGEDYISENID